MSDAERGVHEMLRHFDDLQRYAMGVSEDAATAYADTENEIMLLLYMIFEALGNGKIADNYQSADKLAELQERISAIRYNSAEKVLKMLEEEAKNTVKLEHAFWLLLFAFLSKDGEKIASADLNNIIRYGKYHGLTRRQIIDKVTSADISRIYETIASGLDRNHSLNQIKEDLSTAFKQTRRFITAETETVINGVADDAALAFASANGKKLRYTAVLDLATCGECMDLDGNEYEDGSPDIPYLPRHIHCRCILVPIAGESMKDELDKTNFKKYFENLPDAEKQKRLGKALYEKYVSGELKVDHYITPDRTARLKVDDIAKRDNSALA